MEELALYFESPEFFYRKNPRIPQGVKIKEGIEILYGMYKAKGGLIKTAQEVEVKTVRDIGISGDFTLFLKKGLGEMELALKNTEREQGELEATIEDFYEKTRVQTPGVEPTDVTKAILNVKK